MATFAVKTLGIAAGVSTALLFSGFASQAFAMSPFQASYQFNYNGKNMGSATRTLSKAFAMAGARPARSTDVLVSR